MKPIQPLFGTHQGARALFIGSGASGAQAANKPDWWFNRHYGVVIVPNLGYRALAATAALTKHVKWYSLCVEQPLILSEDWWAIPEPFVRIMRNRGGWVERKFPAVAKERGLEWDAAYLADTYECDMYPQPDWRPSTHYNGLMVGKLEDIPQMQGTCAVQAMHFAYLLGCESYDMIGVEHCCYNGVHHYYEADRKPFARLKGLEPCPERYLVEVDCDGQRCLTHKHFLNSVPFTEKMAARFAEYGMQVHRLCGGLLTKIPLKELPDAHV